MEKITLIGRVSGVPEMALSSPTTRNPEGTEYLKINLATIFYTTKEQTSGEVIRYLSIWDKKLIAKFNAIINAFGAMEGMTLMVEGTPRIGVYDAKDGTKQANLNIDGITTFEWITSSGVTPVHIPAPVPAQQAPVPAQQAPVAAAADDIWKLEL